jgi:polyisoprenoid-binding protein YceI
MARSFSKLITCVLLSSAFWVLDADAQTQYRQTGESYLSISGTSTLHEWTMTSKDTKYQAIFDMTPDGKLSRIPSLTLTVRGESLKSGHTAMDKNAYSTLNTSLHKNIVFELLTSSVSEAQASCEGNLTVAGVTRKISVDATIRILPDKSFLISGTKKLKMSDFNVEAPTFMFGTVTTGDEITVSFNANLVPSKK